MTRIVIEQIEEKTKQKFKTACTINNTTMKDAITKFIESYSDNAIDNEIEKLNKLKASQVV